MTTDAAGGAGPHGSAVSVPVIELRGVARVFDGPSPTRALWPTNLTVHAGDFVAVSGPSGSGKSTLLSIVGLLDRPTEGTYQLAGANTADLQDADETALRGQSIGFVFQSFHLLGYRSAVENVALSSLYRHTRKRQREQAAINALVRVGLEHRLRASPATMSGGERQRVAIARAIVNRPALLLCDEPTGNLDSRNTEQILTLLDDLNRDDGLTIMVVTHEPEVAAHATRQLVMTDGTMAELPNTVNSLYTNGPFPIDGHR
jgi:putative ABC transport system ATP-binding protein